MKNTKLTGLFLAMTSVSLVGCGGSDNNDDDDVVVTPPSVTPPAVFDFELPEGARYTFLNTDGDSTVSYTGQTARHILIADLTSTIGSIEASDDKDAVIADLDFFFEFDSEANGDNDFLFNKGETKLLTNDDNGDLTYNSISSGKNLVGKIAGNDKEAHILGGEFFGWFATETPEAAVDDMFGKLADRVTAEENLTIDTTDADGVTVDALYIDENGLDYKQLVQKFLLGSITFSQGTADYLQTDFAAEENLQQAEGKTYSPAEHKWDEAFGYFGAARNYPEYSDDEIAGKGGRDEFAKGYNDYSGDGFIDLRSEINLGNSTNCAKRDRGAEVATDFTEDAYTAFLTGRAIVNAATALGQLPDDAQTLLDEQIETAAVTWEKCVAATVVHYINDTTGDMDNFSEGKFADLENFEDLAKHWGEMKGFALGLQFNPLSPFRADDASLEKLKEVLTLMGDAPVLADGTQMGEAFDGGVAQYKADLLEARDILEEIYDFDSQNVENW